ncbi:MAG: pentapeptide repeat-containing protein, partial [Anaerolineae bacterium]|nr:pentapeptide repeat-containing protein [Anaerolineae bacterium]
KHADLTDASFVHADLRDANLEHATLSGANLTGAALRDARMPDGKTYERGMDLTRYTAAEKPKRDDAYDEE